MENTNLQYESVDEIHIRITDQLPYEPDIPINQDDDDIELLPGDQNEQ